MDLKLTKIDWENSKRENRLLIINNKLQIEMALRVIELCDKRIKEFPMDEEKPEESKK